MARTLAQDPSEVLRRAPARFLSKVSVASEGDCWDWVGRLDRRGYGSFTLFAKNLRAHRYGYELWRGPIPDAMDLDHLCRNRRCVNPNHLEPVTRRENLLRGETIPAAKAAQTHCMRGHPFDEQNTHVAVNGTRKCRACNAMNARRRRAMAK